MINENCWVWFKGELREKGIWKSGFTCSRDEKPGVLIKNPSYVPCRVPEWRILTVEPNDLHESPEIPEGSAWKLMI